MKEIINSWIGTSFRYRGYTKQGCDCAGLILGVLRDLSININNLLTVYKNHKVGMRDYIDGNKIIKCLDEHFSRIEIKVAKISDIVLLKGKSGNSFHLGIVSRVNPFYIIHANIRVGYVTEMIMDDLFLSKVFCVYSVI